MKKIAIIALVAIGFSACKNKDQFTINGKFENAGNIKKVMLYETDQLVDSAYLNEDSEFKFTRKSPDPDFYTIVANDKNYLIIAQNGDEIDFKADLADASNSYFVEGSEESDKVKEFNSLSNKYGKVYQDLDEQYKKLISEHPQSEDSIRNVLMPVFEKNMDAFSKEALAFAQKNKDNLAGFYAAGTIDQVKYEPELIAYAEDIKSKFPNNKAVQGFVSKMMAVKPISIGHVAPDFELPTPDGKMVKLSDFRGKYVMIDFWASWCAPCRKENPNIVKQYQRFKDKNFTILGVSLDNKKDAWEKAIKDDGLAWTQVSELKEWNGKVSAMYQVESIPASFILDPNGKIIAKNQYGEDLEQFLSKTLL